MIHSVFDNGSFYRYIKVVEERFRLGHMVNQGNGGICNYKANFGAKQDL